MKASHLLCAAVVVTLGASSIGSAATSWLGKNVGTLQSTFEGADCFYFTLEGVSQADPILPGSPWFAIPRTQYGAKDAYAMLLSAKLSGQPVNVVTNGAAACGLAAVSQVYMP